MVVKMFFNIKLAENCYYCIIGPMRYYTGFFGLTNDYKTCKHQSYKSWSRIPIYLNIALILSVAFYNAYLIFIVGTNDKLRLLTLVVGTVIDSAFAGTLIIRAMKSKLRTLQLDQLQNLLLSCKFYGYKAIFPVESMYKLRRTCMIYFWGVTGFLIILLTYCLHDISLSNLFTLALFKKCNIIYVSFYHFIFDSLILIEISVFQEFISRCSTETINILKMKKIINGNENLNFGLDKLRLEVELRYLNCFYRKIIDNTKLYCQFIGPIFTYCVPVFNGILIVNVYSTIKFALNTNRSDVRQEYVVVFLVTAFSTLSFTCVCHYTEKLKRPVSN